ncbi:unnamed protein product [Paramecium octaurelia]|uniref:Transmembrane protein n=1 Tax=Paramecium octaurelia TaxID=43137 RepID=A0A8S1YLT6_PAROT|nr:unnamed protein product [Paramecium octaurelia]
MLNFAALKAFSLQMIPTLLLLQLIFQIILKTTRAQILFKYRTSNDNEILRTQRKIFIYIFSVKLLLFLLEMIVNTTSNPLTRQCFEFILKTMITIASNLQCKIESDLENQEISTKKVCTQKSKLGDRTQKQGFMKTGDNLNNHDANFDNQFSINENEQNDYLLEEPLYNHDKSHFSNKSLPDKVFVNEFDQILQIEKQETNQFESEIQNYNNYEDHSSNNILYVEGHFWQSKDQY